jgi:hypothetical protein
MCLLHMLRVVSLGYMLNRVTQHFNVCRVLGLPTYKYQYQRRPPLLLMLAGLAEQASRIRRRRAWQSEREISYWHSGMESRIERVGMFGIRIHGQNQKNTLVLLAFGKSDLSDLTSTNSHLVRYCSTGRGFSHRCTSTSSTGSSRILRIDLCILYNPL